jgi:hypothetical protein
VRNGHGAVISEGSLSPLRRGSKIAHDRSDAAPGRLAPVGGRGALALVVWAVAAWAATAFLDTATGDLVAERGRGLPLG